MNRRTAWAICLLLICTRCLLADEPTFEQRAQAKRIARDIDQSAKLIEQGDAKQAASYWLRAHQRSVEFMNSADAQQGGILAEHLQRLTALRSTINERGMALPELTILPTVQPAAVPGDPMVKTDAAVLKFDKDVAPILVEKCARCHIDAKRGRFSMATIASLVQDPKLIVATKPDESKLVSIIASGEMPKGRVKVTASELQLLRDWIQEGASFGDADRGKNLKQMARADSASGVVPLADTSNALPAGKDDVVSFSNHIAPILVDQCADCHMNGQRVRGGLNLATFESIMRGGDNGSIIRPSQGEESLLIKKLRGTGGGQQMPAGSTPLAADVIQTIVHWIDQGAKFDGGNPSANLRDVIARAATSKATHEELSKQRAGRAAANWELVMDGKSPVVHESENLVVLAPDEASKPKQFAEIAESVIGRVATQLRVPAKDPFVKGKLAAYFFSARYDYGEFGKMIEKRDVPKDWSNHWGNNQVDAYIVFQVPPTEYDNVRPWIARNVAAAYAKGLASDVPDWFANGWAYWIAAKIYNGEDATKAWTQKATDLTKRMTSRDDFIQGRMTDDEAGLVAFQFVEYLKQTGGNRFNKMISEMRDGASFERAFALAFDMTPAEMLSKK